MLQNKLCGFYFIFFFLFARFTVTLGSRLHVLFLGKFRWYKGMLSSQQICKLPLSSFQLCLYCSHYVLKQKFGFFFFLKVWNFSPFSLALRSHNFVPRASRLPCLFGDRVHFWRHFMAYRKDLPNLVNATWLWNGACSKWILIDRFTATNMTGGVTINPLPNH